VCSWELRKPHLLLHEGHAAHEWEGNAEEHARAMIGVWVGGGACPALISCAWKQYIAFCFRWRFVVHPLFPPSHHPPRYPPPSTHTLSIHPSINHLTHPPAVSSPAGLYEEFARDVAGLPAIAGRRSALGTLRGAAATFTLEAMVGEGRALQVGQSHHLADNYSRMLGASYRSGSGGAGEEGEEGREEFMSQMGSGLQASLLGGLVLAHGDDAGLRLAPALAPTQVGRWWGEGERRQGLALALGKRQALPGHRRASLSALPAPIYLK
jgi:hypothetical protein